MDASVKKAFFALLVSGLWEKVPQASAFPLSPSQWHALYSMAVKQTVEGIVFAGICRLPKECMPPHELRMKWVVRVERIERRNQWMNDLINQQIHTLAQLNVQPWLLKGQAVASTYANPLLRVSGDVDWYIGGSAKGYKKIARYFKEKGTPIIEYDGDSIALLWNRCEVELHRQLIDTYNPFSGAFIQRLLAEEMRHAVHVEHRDMRWKTLSPLLTHVQVSTHILKHMLTYGIGLRQCCDVARICYHYADTVDGERLRQIYRKLGVLRWIELLYQMLVTYLALPKEALPFRISSSRDTSWMMDEIWQAGNFGLEDDRYDIEKERQQAKRVDIGLRIWRNARKYIAYAPLEVLGFPIYLLRAKFNKRFFAP